MWRAGVVAVDRARGARTLAHRDYRGAQERRGFEHAVAVRDRKHVARSGDAMLGEPAGERVAGEPGLATQVLAFGRAVRARAARPTEPWHAAQLAARDSGRAAAKSGDSTDELMAAHERQFRSRELA